MITLFKHELCEYHHMIYVAQLGYTAIAFIVRPILGQKKNSEVSNSIFFFRQRSFDCDCLQCYRLKWILMHPVTYKVA